MNGEYHRQLCQDTLSEKFSPEALTLIADANVQQDSLIGLFHDEYHYHHPLMDVSSVYIETQRALTIRLIKAGEVQKAQQSFGRLLHAAHDYYAHTNYVKLWAAHYGETDIPPIAQFDGLNESILNDPDLFPCKIYLFRDYLYFFPPAREWVLNNIPADSHARMHLDNPDSGKFFDYAMEGARQRTTWELDQILDQLEVDEGELFFK